MNQEHNLKKMYWHSRRGMLELDLLLVPFAKEQLAQQSAEVQSLYQLLLAEEDQDLFNWLIKKLEAPSVQLQQMIDIILSSSNLNPVLK